MMPELGGPIFGRSVNPIRTGEGRLSPPITTGPPNVSHLPASLGYAGFGLEKNQETRKEF